MPTNALEIRGIGKRYKVGKGEAYLTIRDSISNALRSLRRSAQPEPRNTFWALRDVSFDVPQGSRIGIIGRNGAGKSTLLKVLSQITCPTTGSINVRGRVTSLLEVGTGFHPELTGRENIFLNGAILGMSRREILSQFDSIVAFAEIEKFMDTPVKRYSSGMYVRLAFSVAAHLQSEVLLVDEVLAVGDMAFQEKCLGRMSEIAESGRTILFVSHNMAAVKKLCDRGVVLKSGLLDFDGSIDGAVENYVGDHASGAQGQLLDYCSYKSPAIKLENVWVNGSLSDELVYPSDARCLDIAIDGTLSENATMDLEFRLYDQFMAPLAFYSHGHLSGVPSKFKAGAFSTQRRIALPMMTKGRFYGSISLCQPGVMRYVDIPHGLRLIVEGNPTATGQVFEYQKNGWVVLEDGQQCSGV